MEYLKLGLKNNDTIIISSVQIIPRVIVMENEMLNQTYVKVYVDPFINRVRVM